MSSSTGVRMSRACTQYRSIWSVCSRRRLASIEVTIFLRWLPALFGSPASVWLVNLVASTNRSRRAHRSGAAIDGSGGPHQFGDNFFPYRTGVLIPVTVVVENDPWIRLVTCD